MTSFEDRQRHLFNQLNEAEKQANFVTQTPSNASTNFADRSVVRQQVRQTRAEMKQFRGKESIFKRPEAPLAQCVAARKVPGFRKNPDKWVCYNLENVDISDRSNSAAAAICLKEVLNQDETLINGDIMETSDSKVTFRTPMFVAKPKTRLSESKAISFKNTMTVIYPEHVVGQKEKEVRVKRDKPKAEKAKLTQLRLDHLLDDGNDSD